jgi:hypothetical protein
VRVLTDRHPKLEIEILVTARQFSLLKREADTPGRPSFVPSRGIDRFARDSPLEESGFEPLVPLGGQHNRGSGPMSPSVSSAGRLKMRSIGQYPLRRHRSGKDNGRNHQ